MHIMSPNYTKNVVIGHCDFLSLISCISIYIDRLVISHVICILYTQLTRAIVVLWITLILIMYSLLNSYVMVFSVHIYSML